MIRKSESRKVQMEQAFPFLINVIKYPSVKFLLWFFEGQSG